MGDNQVPLGIDPGSKMLIAETLLAVLILHYNSKGSGLSLNDHCIYETTTNAQSETCASM